MLLSLDEVDPRGELRAAIELLSAACHPPCSQERKTVPSSKQIAQQGNSGVQGAIADHRAAPIVFEKLHAGTWVGEGHEPLHHAFCGKPPGDTKSTVFQNTMELDEAHCDY